MTKQGGAVLSTKASFFDRQFYNTIATFIVAYLAWRFGLVSIASEIGTNDLVAAAAVILVAVPLVIEFLVQPIEKIFLVKLITFGFFGLISRMLVWGATVWYLPSYFRVYNLNTSLANNDDIAIFLLLIAVLAVLHLKKKD